VPRELAEFTLRSQNPPYWARQEPEDSGKWKVRVDIRHLGVSVSTTNTESRVNRTFPADAYSGANNLFWDMSLRDSRLLDQVFFDPDEDVRPPIRQLLRQRRDASS